MIVLFKGYNGKEWIYGYPIFTCNETYIQEYSERETEKVLKDSLCMYTGLDDCCGKKIFENDIVELDLFKKRVTGVVKFVDGCFIVESDEFLLNGARHDYLKCYTCNHACKIV